MSLTVAFIIFAMCITRGSGVPLADRAIIDEEFGSGGVPCGIKDLLQVKKTLNKLSERLMHILLVGDINMIKGLGLTFEEFWRAYFKVTAFIKEVDEIISQDRFGDGSGSGSQDEREEGSAGFSCNPEELRRMQSKLADFIPEIQRFKPLAAFIQDLRRFTKRPLPTADPWTAAPSSVPEIDQFCPGGWVFHEGSCFHIIDTPTPEWRVARKNCQQIGADLAKITSDSENQFILDLLRNQKTATHYGVWLGLFRRADGKFYWTDDTPLTGFMDWAAREPNNSGGRENCAHKIGKHGSWPFNDGEWNDVPCSLSGIVPSPITPVVLCQKEAADYTDAFSFY